MAKGPAQARAEPAARLRQNHVCHCKLGRDVKTIEFELREDFIPLDDLLKATGIASSGGAAKAMISQGKVRLDGVIELRKTRKVFAGQMVETEAASIRIHARTRPPQLV